MTCHEYRDRVDEIVDGLLPPEEVGRFDAHAGDCEECTERRVEAQRFRALLDAEGGVALESWEASRLALLAATDGTFGDVLAEYDAEVHAGVDSGADSAAPSRPRAVRPRFLRVAAAAVIVAACGYGLAGMLGDQGPQVLAMDAPINLSSGDQALVTGPGRLVRAETRGVALIVRERDGHAVVDLQRGDAHFRLEPGMEVAIATPQGDIEAFGAVFLVDVRGDGAVAVDVQSGRVVFEGAEHLYRGDRLEVDPSGRSILVSRSRLEQLALERELLAKEVSELREHAVALEDQMASFGAAAGRGDDGSAGGELPFDDLGTAQWTLLDRSLARSSPAKQDAMALIYSNAAGIRETFGVTEPHKAMSDPLYVAKIASGLFRGLAPSASESNVEAVVEATRATMDAASAALEGETAGVARGAAMQRAYLDMLRAVERNLGVEAAAAFVESFPREWRGLSTFTWRLDDRTESTMVDYWSGQLELTEVQIDELRRLVRVYLQEAQVAQREVTAMLPAADAERLLFGRNGGRFGAFRGGRSGWKARPGSGASGSASSTAPSTGVAPSAGTGSADDGDDDAPRTGWGGMREGGPAKPQLGPSERVASKFRDLEALLHLAEPRIRFETALRSLLRADQRDKGFRPIPQILVFRPADAE